MLDGVSLDQLRTFIAAVDEGSFSAAARKLNRVQSAVSGWVGGLEDQIGVVLFDRSGRFPKLTPAGVLLLADARNIVSGVDTLKARAKLMASGLETELSVVIDVFFPTAVVSTAAKAFAIRFPLTPLRLFVEGLGAAYQPVPGRSMQPGHPGDLAALVSLTGQRGAGRCATGLRRRRKSPARELWTSNTEARAGEARPTGAHRQVGPYGGTRLRRRLAIDLASGRLVDQVCVPQGLRGMGRHAVAHGREGSRSRNVDGTRCGKHVAPRPHIDDVCLSPVLETTGSRRQVVH